MSSKNTTSTTSLRLFATAVAVMLPLVTQAITYEVSPGGEPYSLTAALDAAGPGDTISLSDGTYDEPIVTMAGGEEDRPLVIKGGRGAVISAFSGDKNMMWSQKVVDVRHSWITLQGFTVDGELNDEDVEESYVDKCIFIEGQAEPTMVEYRGSTVHSALIGFVMEGMHITNCGMECVRARNYVTHSVISDNFIENCGIYDYRFQFDGKVGEAIYLGTSSNQWTTFPDDSNYQEFAGEGYPDECNYNLITGNVLTPRGNECVDVKEGASFNVIEHNVCSDQRDEESGCYDSRGNENTFRNNYAGQCLGGGIRLGGHVIDGFVYGVDNIVYGNDFEDTGDGSIKSRQEPQGLICGNSCSGSGDCDVSEEGDDEEIESTWDQPCPETLPTVPYIDDVPPPAEMPVAETPAPTPAEMPVAETPAPVAQPTAPTAPSGSSACIGILSDQGSVCCDEACGECGGAGCSSRSPGADHCCVSNILDTAEMCSARDMIGPCIIDDDGVPAPAPTPETAPVAQPIAPTASSGDSTCVGILSPQGYACCAEACGECGGTGCSSRSPGADSCCVSNVLDTAELCSATDMIGPCVVDHDDGSPDTNVEQTYKYIGCFSDENNTGRIMEYVTKDTAMAIELCAEICGAHAFFGTQFGHECWCGDGGADGNGHLVHGESESCTYACEGDEEQTCGGRWAMSVYENL